MSMTPEAAAALQQIEDGIDAIEAAMASMTEASRALNGAGDGSAYDDSWAGGDSGGYYGQGSFFLAPAVLTMRKGVETRRAEEAS